MMDTTKDQTMDVTAEWGPANDANLIIIRKTPRERAEALLDQMRKSPHLWTQEFVSLVEDSIIESIEEEREACARLLDNAADEWQQQGNYPRFENLTHYAQEIRNRNRPK